MTATKLMPHSNNLVPFAHLAALNHRHVISSPSTNSELIDAIKSSSLNANKPHLLTADTQTAGRGQRGRSWQSPVGNVYLSLYHPLTQPVSGLLSLIIGVELAKVPIIQAFNKQLSAQGLTPIGVKWANDLGFYKPTVLNKFADKPATLNANNNNAQTDSIEPNIIYFNKLAGILIEPVWHISKLVGVVMGVGLNVQATPQLTAQTLEGMSYQALSLQDINALIAEKTPDDKSVILPPLSELYVQVSQALLAALDCFKHLNQPSSTSAMDDFMQDFNQLDALAGQHLQVTQNHNGEVQIVTGFADGIDTQGCLQLRQDGGKLAAIFTGRIDVIESL